MDELPNKLQALNCRYNFKVEKNGKCYSEDCVMNCHFELKEDIKKNGCKVYQRKEVQDLLNKVKK